MALTSAHLTNLDEAIASGVKHGQTDDKSLTWRSLDELFKLRAWVAGRVNSSSETRTTYVQHSRD